MVLELSAEGKARREKLLPVAVSPAGAARALSRRAAPPGTAFPLPELLRLPPAWRIRVESGWWGCRLGAGCTAAASFFGWNFFKISFARSCATSVPKSSSSPGPAQGSISSSDIFSSRHLGPSEGEKNSCSAQTFLPLRQRGFIQNLHPRAEMGMVPFPHQGEQFDVRKGILKLKNRGGKKLHQDFIATFTPWMSLYLAGTGTRAAGRGASRA